jgi:diguanylate cyclase (GGDEF)-like protein
VRTVLRLFGWPRRWCAGWALWRLPVHLRRYVLLVVCAAAAVTTATAFLVPVTGSDGLRFAVLAACAAVHIELTRQIERKREHLRGDAPYLDLKSVWSFAAVIVLPPALASAMVVCTYLFAWWRIWPGARPVPLYRWIFSGATVLIATQAVVAVLAVGMHHYPGVPASTVLASLSDYGVLLAAAVLRWTINGALVYAALAISNPETKLNDLFGNFGEHLLEGGAMALGVVAAKFVVGNPVDLVPVVLVLVALHRGLLLSQFQLLSRTDGKTGLSTARWWQQIAEKIFSTAHGRGTTMGVLIIDIDHFKGVNDRYGHLVGDRVLRAVAEEIQGETRGQDVCGRWGGEEFVVAIADVGTRRNLFAVAERIRLRVRALHIDDIPGDAAAEITTTVSIGGVCYPSAGLDSVDDLVRVADNALYRAKESGRDQVQLANGNPPLEQDQHAFEEPPAG